MVSILGAVNSANSQSVMFASGNIKSSGYADIENSLSAGNNKSTENSFYEYCKNNNVSNLDDFNHYKAMYANSSEVDTSEYKFSEYMGARGCSGPEELELLNSTGFNTLAELQEAVSKMVSAKLKAFGFDLSGNEVEALVSKMGVKDLSNFYNATIAASKEPTATGKEAKEISALGTLLGKFIKADGISPDLKAKLEEISKSVETYMKYLNANLKKEEEESEYERRVNGGTGKPLEEVKEENVLQSVDINGINVSIARDDSAKFTEQNSEFDNSLIERHSKEQRQKYKASLIAGYKA